jgi:hypothetical protein
VVIAANILEQAGFAVVDAMHDVAHVVSPDLDAVVMLAGKATASDAQDTLRTSLAAVTAERDEARRVIGQYVPMHDSPFRPLLANEIEKLRGLCESRQYLFWWDMGSALVTLDAVVAERDALAKKVEIAVKALHGLRSLARARMRPLFMQAADEALAAIAAVKSGIRA